MFAARKAFRRNVALVEKACNERSRQPKQFGRFCGAERNLRWQDCYCVPLGEFVSRRTQYIHERRGERQCGAIGQLEREQLSARRCNRERDPSGRVPIGFAWLHPDRVRKHTGSRHDLTSVSVTSVTTMMGQRRSKGGTSLRKFRAGAAGRFSTDLDFYARDDDVTVEVIAMLADAHVDGFVFRIGQLGGDGRLADLGVRHTVRVAHLSGFDTPFGSLTVGSRIEVA